jgi:CheY-like chemotaxis protein
MVDALVIDDNRKLADVLVMMLDMLGVKGRAVYGSRSGLMALEEEIPDVIFLDINMPGVDGFEVLSYLRRVPGCKRVPVVVVTSDDQPDTAKRAKELGAVTLIVKPVTVDILESALIDTGILEA